MAENVLGIIKRSLDEAESQYYRLVLLVSESGSGKSTVLHKLADKLGIDVININLSISTNLLELTAKQRALRLPDALNQIVDNAQATVVLDNLEILFDKTLQQDPLRLLQGISRNRTVVASWNGKIDNGKLIYAEPGHTEYKSYELGDIITVGMDGKSALDNENNN